MPCTPSPLNLFENARPGAGRVDRDRAAGLDARLVRDAARRARRAGRALGLPAGPGADQRRRTDRRALRGDRMNPRIESGTRAMLALREAALAAGETPLGWKVGLGSPAAFERLGTDRPLAGFLLRSGLLADGAVVDIVVLGQPAPRARGRRRDRRRRRHRERGRRDRARRHDPALDRPGRDPAHEHLPPPRDPRPAPPGPRRGRDRPPAARRRGDRALRRPGGGHGRARRRRALGHRPPRGPRLTGRRHHHRLRLRARALSARAATSPSSHPSAPSTSSSQRDRDRTPAHAAPHRGGRRAVAPRPVLRPRRHVERKHVHPRGGSRVARGQAAALRRARLRAARHHRRRRPASSSAGAACS